MKGESDEGKGRENLRKNTEAKGSQSFVLNHKASNMYDLTLRSSPP